MTPYSRGCPPNEYTLRVPCSLGIQFSFSEKSNLIELEIDGVMCRLTEEEGYLIIIASGFQTQRDACDYFASLKRRLASVSLLNKIALSVPTTIVEPIQANVSFMAEDSRCIALGWPLEDFCPLLIPKYSASVYPEHERVAIESIMCIRPSFIYPLGEFGAKLAVDSPHVLPNTDLDDELLLAIAGYADASRSSLSVWSFLHVVMMLEMLSMPEKASLPTRRAIKELTKYAESEYTDVKGVDMIRITESLRFAEDESITSAVKRLV